MKAKIFCFLLVLCSGLQAQKKRHNQVLASNIDLIQIDAANCFIVEVNTVVGNEINVEAEMEGEYSQDLDLEVVTNGTTLLIKAGFTPNFENPNDKLSAHKVISILLRLTMPLHKKVEVFGTNSRVNIEGEYKELNITLSDGACLLKNVQAKANVKTQSGSVKVISNAANVKAISKYGTVSANPIPIGHSTFKVQTVTGNIDLSKTE
ncbi:hypothetical protein [Maribacter sp. Asnod1-A12]|uniref:hypothetical protein n=1 Tax=Maribacter sp. Asnod1-A12 TaxID=3160576 RepID=UPI00386B1933